MESILEFLKLANVPAKIITQLTSEDVKDVKVLAEEYNSDRKEYYTDIAISENKKKIGDEAVTGYTKSIMKELFKINSIPVTNSKLNELVEEGSHLTFFADELAKTKQSLKTDAEKALREENERLLGELTKLDEEKNELLKDFEIKLSEKDNLVKEDRRRLKVEHLYNQYTLAQIKEDKCVNDPYKIKKLREEALAEIAINEDNSTITDIKGNKLRHPQKDTLITTFEEYFELKKQEAGLNPVSNAGKLPKGFEIPPGGGGGNEIKPEIADKWAKMAKKSGLTV